MQMTYSSISFVSENKFLCQDHKLKFQISVVGTGLVFGKSSLKLSSSFRFHQSIKKQHEHSRLRHTIEAESVAQQLPRQKLQVWSTDDTALLVPSTETLPPHAQHQRICTRSTLKKKSKRSLLLDCQVISSSC